MALMDLMSRNPDVGAVCGRTHPLGSGPMVWYQIFDYAIGHWLLKVKTAIINVTLNSAFLSVYILTKVVCIVCQLRKSNLLEWQAYP